MRQQQVWAISARLDICRGNSEAEPNRVDSCRERQGLHAIADPQVQHVGGTACNELLHLRGCEHRAVRELVVLDPVAVVVRRLVLRRIRQQHARNLPAAPGEIERVEDPLVGTVGAEAINRACVTATTDVHLRHLDAGTEFDCIRAVAAAIVPDRAAIRQLRKEPGLRRLVDDLRASLGRNKVVRVVALATAEVIVSVTADQYVVVSKAQDDVVTGSAVKELSGRVIRLPAVIDDVVAAAGIYRAQAPSDDHVGGGAGDDVLEDFRSAASRNVDGACDCDGVHRRHDGRVVPVDGDLVRQSIRSEAAVVEKDDGASIHDGAVPGDGIRRCPDFALGSKRCI